MAPPDPYTEVQCSVCHGTSDECLLLLCDLCDSAAHTYCVGLGATVPEDDWFCRDCTLLRDEHVRSETDATCDGSFGDSPKTVSAEAHVSVFDIVRESSVNELRRPPATVGSIQFSSPALAREISEVDRMTESDSRRQPIVGHSATNSGARTLRHCRNVRSRIRSLRENWNAFRTGALIFSSSSVHQQNDVRCIGSGQPHSSSCSSQKVTAQNEHSNVLPSMGSHDIDKAWKMMDVAKSLGSDRKRTSSVHPASKHPIRKANAQKAGGKVNLKVLTSNNKLVNKDGGTTRLEDRYSSIKDDKKDKCQVLQKEKESSFTMKGDRNLPHGLLTAHVPVCWESQSSRVVQTSALGNIFHRNGGDPQHENFLGSVSTVFHKSNGSTCLSAPVRSVPKAPNVHHGRKDLDASSTSKSDGKGKFAGERCVDSRTDEAKSEVQSLVKLNLKLLTREKNLEVNVFKEVARLATHSILGACGFERQKPGLPSFPSSVCCHADEQQVRRSTLMPTSCRECFFVFVKDVVGTIFFERMAS